MKLEPVAAHDHLFDDQPQDGLLELEARILEPVAKLPPANAGHGVPAPGIAWLAPDLTVRAAARILPGRMPPA